MKISFRRKRLAGHIAQVRKMRNAHKVLIRLLHGRDYSLYLVVEVKIILKCIRQKYTTKMWAAVKMLRTVPDGYIF
jgi:hypothetical protein